MNKEKVLQPVAKAAIVVKREAPPILIFMGM